ncbi:MAG: SMP-30/gluconolactonase/LRE family protein [Acidimicrobiia bacterium]
MSTSAASPSTQVLLDDRGFLEGPRWHDGKLWLSDLHRHQVLTYDAGELSAVAELDDQPSGLGFLPTGDVLIVSLLHRRLLRGETLAVHADLVDLTIGGTNDMIVDRLGRAYVGSFGYDLFAKAPVAPGNLVLVTAEGNARVVAEDLAFPNGMAITADGCLLVAESYANTITAFDIADDGTLANRRVWAEVPGVPDGVSLDAGGALWVALGHSDSIVRVEAGGQITDRVTLRPEWNAVSCALGGDDGRTLFITTAKFAGRVTTARLESIRVEVPALSRS